MMKGEKIQGRGESGEGCYQEDNRLSHPKQVSLEINLVFDEKERRGGWL